MDKVIQSVHPQTIERIAGSGNKFVHMAEGNSDFYVNLVPGFKHWDMCGSEAILAARFGIVTDAKSEPLIYDGLNGQHTFHKGILAAKNKRTLDVAHERISAKLGLSLSECHELVAKAAEESKRLRKLESNKQKEWQIIEDIKNDRLRHNI